MDLASDWIVRVNWRKRKREPFDIVVSEKDQRCQDKWLVRK